MSTLDQALDQLGPSDTRTVIIGAGMPPVELPRARRHDWGWSCEDQDASAPPMSDRGVIRGPLAVAAPKLLVMDVDSTLTTSEAIDLLAEAAGAGQQVAEITERAMHGELDFAESLAERVATLEGLPVGILDEVRRQVEFQPGAEALVQALTAAGARVGVVSGGFIEIVRPNVEAIGIHYATANTLEVQDGRLTGRTVGEVIDRQAKKRHLLRYCELTGCTPQEAVAIGDGANDLDMLDAAGLGIAYCAKPVTAAQADATISFPRLDAALGYLQMG